MTIQDLHWGAFRKEKDGEWEGLNNAAINSFNSNIINSFVREMFQNSIDARDPNLPKNTTTGKRPPLRVRITYLTLKQSEFPDFNGFYKVFKAIASSKPNRRHAKFFNHGFSDLGDKKKITFFAFEDYNTTGLSGEDDDPTSTFNACVVSEGISVKNEETAGGSFGIGKNAIFGFSKLRTVFYSSNNPKGEFVFQGKAKLASYYDDEGATRENKIYLGIGSTRRSIRQRKELDEPYNDIFYRKEPGLSQFAVAPVKDEEWADQFTIAILRNYWLLLEKGELEVELRQQDETLRIINKGNLEECLLEWFDPETYEPDDVPPEGNPYEYFRCYRDGMHIPVNDFEFLKKVSFYYRELENAATNRIAYIRNDMVVYSKPVHGFGSIQYCGVFLCDDDGGNLILRDMEPPTHDSFNADRLQDSSTGVTVKDGYAILKAIKSLVKENLQKIKDQYTKETEDIPWLDSLLSSLIGSAGAGSGDPSKEESEQETTERVGSNIDRTLIFSSIKRNAVINHEEGHVLGTGGGTGAGSGGSGGSGNGSGTGGVGGGPKGKNPSRKTKIKSRIFRSDRSQKINGKNYRLYRAILSTDQPIPAADIILSQQGDSGNVAMFELGKIVDSNSKQLSFSIERNRSGQIQGYRIGNVKLPTEIVLFVNEPYKSSFSIVDFSHNP